MQGGASTRTITSSISSATETRNALKKGKFSKPNDSRNGWRLSLQASGWTAAWVAPALSNPIHGRVGQELPRTARLEPNFRSLQFHCKRGKRSRSTSGIIIGCLKYVAYNHNHLRITACKLGADAALETQHRGEIFGCVFCRYLVLRSKVLCRLLNKSHHGIPHGYEQIQLSSQRLVHTNEA